MARDNNDSFGDTAERWAEMGIGMALAGQMGRVMNQAMAESMPKPAQGQGDSGRLYYAVIDSRQAGPFSETEIVRLIGDKKLVKETLVWHQGMAQWKQAQDVPEILRIITLTPPPFEGGVV
jgi:hypothetical protein